MLRFIVFENRTRNEGVIVRSAVSDLVPGFRSAVHVFVEIFTEYGSGHRGLCYGILFLSNGSEMTELSSDPQIRGFP